MATASTLGQRRAARQISRPRLPAPISPIRMRSLAARPARDTRNPPAATQVAPPITDLRNVLRAIMIPLSILPFGTGVFPAQPFDSFDQFRHSHHGVLGALVFRGHVTVVAA